MMNSKITALYCRLSSDDIERAESNSITHQKILLEQFALSNSLTNFKFYVDDGYTGTNFMRPAYNKLMQDIKDGLVEVLIVKDLSRLGRNYLDVGYYIERLFPQHNVRFIAISDNIDSANGYDDFIAIRNIINENYARDLSKKQKTALFVKGNSGKRLTTKAIYGYKKDKDNDNQWIVDDEPAKVVKRIFSLCLAGYGTGQIATILKNDKVKIPSLYFNRIRKDSDSKDPFRWSIQTVSNILSRQEYCGDTVNFKTHRQDFRTKKIVKNSKEDYRIFENTHEAIISRDDFEKVQNIRNQRKRIERIETPETFTGLVFCCDCGKRMHIMRSRNIKEQDCYLCSTYRKNQTCKSHYITTKKLETLVNECFEKILKLSKQSLLSVKIQNEKNYNIEKDREITSLSQRYDDIQKILKSLYEDRVNKKISLDIFNLLADNFSKEAEMINHQLQNISKCQNRDIDDEAVSSFFEYLEDFKLSKLQSIDYDFAHKLISKIVIYETEKNEKGKTQKIEIYLNGIGRVYFP